MSAPVALVTGASSGIGYQTALGLARRGWRVLTASRQSGAGAERAEALRRESGNPEVAFFPADLSSLAEVRALAERVRREAPRLDALVNNAGGYFGRRRTTVDGYEMTFALNHLAPFLLTNLLLGHLAEGARIVTVSSDAARAGRLHQDVMLEQGYNGWKAYAQSKLANLLFTFELARRLEGRGVSANALHPGTVATGFGKGEAGATKLLFTLIAPLLRSPAQGAETVLYLAADPAVAGVSGRYFKDKREVAPPKAALEREAQARLWQLSERLTGLQQGAAAA